MKPMLANLVFDMPEGNDWLYEVKYDGFRAMLQWTAAGEIKLSSRNGNDLLPQFPEIAAFLKEEEKLFSPYAPFILDGELVQLTNEFKADFSAIQVRGRMRSKAKITKQAADFPCKLLIFDCLQLKGENIADRPFQERKTTLMDFFKGTSLPLSPNMSSIQLIQFVPVHRDFQKLWDNILLHDGEGVMFKRPEHAYEPGVRSVAWLKFKNWKYTYCFITAFGKDNEYYYVGVYRGQEIVPIGQFLFGIKPEEKNALKQIIKSNKTGEDNKFIYVEPAICVELKYLEMYDEQMREPHFHQFCFNMIPAECTYDKFTFHQRNLPADLQITHPEKPLWKKPDIHKMEYIQYLLDISPYMLPFLKDRLLTVIRYPHGMLGKAFYQKNCPEYAPSFVHTHKYEDIDYIICEDLKTLLWLGNQLAFEFHIPFETIHANGPSEIVFDLDPQSRDGFPLAVKAAQLIKEVLDGLNLTGFVKTSGNKGLQVYIPVPDNTYSYDDTRLFTTFIAQFLISKEPETFTIERLKKNRGNKLYIDYIQHAEGKTIIAPYSARGNEDAAVAAPLYWEELNESLQITDFSITNMLNRIKTLGDPFQDYFKIKHEQLFAPVIEFLKRRD